MSELLNFPDVRAKLSEPDKRAVILAFAYREEFANAVPGDGTPWERDTLLHMVDQVAEQISEDGLDELYRFALATYAADQELDATGAQSVAINPTADLSDLADNAAAWARGYLQRIETEYGVTLLLKGGA